MSANFIIEGRTWRGPRPRRMSVVPVRLTSDLLSRIRDRGIPVSQFLREAGEKAIEAMMTEPQK